MDADEILLQLRDSGRLHAPTPQPEDPYRDALMERYFSATAPVFESGSPDPRRRDVAQFLDGTRDPYEELVTGLLADLVNSTVHCEAPGRLFGGTPTGLIETYC